MNNSQIIRKIIINSPLFLGCLFIQSFILSKAEYFIFTFIIINISISLSILELSSNSNQFRNKNELIFHILKNNVFGLFIFFISKYTFLKMFGLFYAISWLSAYVIQTNFDYVLYDDKNLIISKNIDADIYFNAVKKPLFAHQNVEIFIKGKIKKEPIIINENSFMLEKKIKPKNELKRVFGISIIHKKNKIFDFFRTESLFIPCVKKPNQISQENQFEIIDRNDNNNLFLNNNISRISYNNNNNDAYFNNNNSSNVFLFQNSYSNSSNIFSNVSNLSNSNNLFNDLNSLSISQQNTFYDSFREREVERHQTIVHCTTYGKKYHSGGCGYLHSSDYTIALEKAKQRGLGPCSRCCPPY